MAAVLKVIHKRKDNLLRSPFFSLKRLRYVDEMSYKLDKGLQKTKCIEIYVEWMKILAEQGVYNPIWNYEDMRLVRNIISRSQMSEMLLEELLPFRTKELAFTYEILGFTRRDVDMFFDWLRIIPDERFMDGLDEPDGGVST